MFAKICIFATENQLFKKEGSRPTWACGLKRKKELEGKGLAKSRPTWACGLKLLLVQLLNLIYNMSRPTWACGLKHISPALVETKLPSRPTWACGLKPLLPFAAYTKICHAPRGRVD